MLEITELPEGFSETALAIGKFDGVHLGHQQLIHELVTQAEEHALAPVVVSKKRASKYLISLETLKYLKINYFNKINNLQDFRLHTAI